MRNFKIITWNMEAWKHGNAIERQKNAWNKIFQIENLDIALLQECIEPDAYFECISFSSDGLKVFYDKNTKRRVFWRQSHTSAVHKQTSWGTAIYISEKNKDKKIVEEKALYPKDELSKGKIMIIKFESYFIASVHIDTNSSLPIFGLEHLKNVFSNELIEKGNLIIGGDLNADRKHDDSYPQFKFNENFFKPLLEGNNKKLNECDLPEENTSLEYNWQDDHIFTSLNIAPNPAKIDRNVKEFSDHAIVEVNLNLEVS